MSEKEFRIARNGENVLDYVDEMWFYLIENNIHKITGEHCKIKIELTQIDEEKQIGRDICPKCGGELDGYEYATHPQEGPSTRIYCTNKDCNYKEDYS